MSFNTIFFDLDDTLYPKSNGLWAAIRERIDLYMHQTLDIPAADIPEIRHQYYVSYGTTLKGLLAHFDINAEEYLNFVHDLPLENYLQPDPQLRDMLFSLPARRWVFTNSDYRHAQRVLEHLGITDCFEGVVDVWALDPYCKPQAEAYQRALSLAGAPPPEACALLEDSPKNLKTARQMGFFTILIGENGNPTQSDRVIPDIHLLAEAVPELWSLDGR